MMFYQNFDLPVVPKNELFVQTVNEGSRSEHAHELLGHAFAGSLAERAGTHSQLNIAIYQQFKKRLPKKDRWQASTLANVVIEESAKYQLDPVFIMAVIDQESSFRSTARGPVGEIGLMQLRPETAAGVAQKHGMPFHGARSLTHPCLNLKLGIAYMSDLRLNFKKRASRYVSAYNMGAKNVRRVVASQQIPKEYSRKVMQKYANLYLALNSTNLSQARHIAMEPTGL